MIALTMNKEVRKRNISRCREKGIALPTFAQMKEPERAPRGVQEALRTVGLWDVNPMNLHRITWRNQPVASGGLFGEVNYLEIPRELTRVPARIIALVGKWFPTGAHKVGATYGCLAPALVSGSFDSTRQKAAWPSTGNYCRGGAFNSALLGCQSIAILPEGMSRERFEWLSKIAGEVITTPGSESNVKEIFDKCHELSRDRGDDIVIFNQFEEFGNYLWHYEVTGAAIARVLQKELGAKAGCRIRLLHGLGGNHRGGRLAEAGVPGGEDRRRRSPAVPHAAGQRLRGAPDRGHRRQARPLDPQREETPTRSSRSTTRLHALLRLFNEKAGSAWLGEQGIPQAFIEKLPLLGISGIANILAAIKMARYYELAEDDVVVTILTDSMELYGSRVKEMARQGGELDRGGAIALFHESLAGQRADNLLELTYPERKRVHNLKYYTWVEQQGKSIDELNAQWSDPTYWTSIQGQAAHIDQLIQEFNAEAGTAP